MHLQGEKNPLFAIFTPFRYKNTPHAVKIDLCKIALFVTCKLTISKRFTLCNLAKLQENYKKVLQNGWHSAILKEPKPPRARRVLSKINKREVKQNENNSNGIEHRTALYKSGRGNRASEKTGNRIRLCALVLYVAKRACRVRETPRRDNFYSGKRRRMRA